jgi:hypothetical protein
LGIKMTDQRNPYSAPSANVAAVIRRRFWLSRTLVASASAFLALIFIFLFEERRHFADMTNDPALFKLALPYLVAVSCISGIACSFSRQRRLMHAGVLGLMSGPLVAFVAYNLYPVVDRWLGG